MSNNYQPIQNENYKIISFNIRHSSHLNIWKLHYHRIVDRRYCLFPNTRTRWHIKTRTKKEATGFRRFVLVRPKTIGNGGLFGLQVRVPRGQQAPPYMESIGAHARIVLPWPRSLVRVYTLIHSCKLRARIIPSLRFAISSTPLPNPI